MNFIKSILVVFVFILVGFLSSQKIDAKTTTVLFKPQNQSVSPPLTKESVREYIETRIAEYKLQKGMQDRASEYDSIIKTFYQKRKVLLESQGWIVEDFKNTGDRIFTVQNAMEQEIDLKSKEEFNKEISEIEANTYYSAEQKSQLIEFLSKDRRRVLEEVIEPTKPDWPAVKAYLKELDHLNDYLAGNRSDPPVLE